MAGKNTRIIKKLMAGKNTRIIRKKETYGKRSNKRLESIQSHATNPETNPEKEEERPVISQDTIDKINIGAGQADIVNQQSLEAPEREEINEVIRQYQTKLLSLQEQAKRLLINSIIVLEPFTGNWVIEPSKGLLEFPEIPPEFEDLRLRQRGEISGSQAVTPPPKIKKIWPWPPLSEPRRSPRLCLLPQPCRSPRLHAKNDAAI